MFGNSEWFGETQNKKVLKPAHKKGWWFYGGWGAVIAVPALIIGVAAGWPQALIWLAVAGVVFVIDYRQILNTKRQTEAYNNLFFIGDQTEVSSGETERYEIHIKD